MAENPDVPPMIQQGRRDYVGEEEVETFNFLEYLRMIVSHRYLIVGVTLVAFMGGVAYFSKIPNIYTADVKIIVERTENTPKSAQQPIVKDSETELYIDEDVYYGTQIAVLTGRQIQDKVLNELGIEAGFTIKATRRRGTRIIELSVDHAEPEWAAKIANKFAEVFVRESAYSDSYISEQILRLIPESGELPEGGPPPVDLSGFDKQLYAESLSSITDDPEIQTMRLQKLTNEVKLKELSERYLPEHPEIVKLNKQLQYLDAQIKLRTKRILDNLRANLAGKVNFTNIRILEEALVPTLPSKPNRTKGVLKWTLVGFFIGCALAFTIEKTNKKVWVAKDLYPTVAVSFLGYVPMIKEIAQNKKKILGRSPTPVSLVDIMAKHTLLADMIAGIRTHVLFSMRPEKSRRIMFSSAIPDEGKSSVSILFALSLVSLGHKVLLIDADMRRPFLHSYLQLLNNKGLSDYLIADAPFDDIVQALPQSELKVITGGMAISNPTELLSSLKFQTLLDEADHRFDRIVIDVPPVLCIPDGLVVAKYVHSGILVCGSGMVVRKALKTVVNKFESIGHNLIGIVINRAGYEKEGYYKYRYASSYQKYYHHQRMSKSSRPKKGSKKPLA